MTAPPVSTPAPEPIRKISAGRRAAALLIALFLPTGSGLVFLGRYIGGGLWHFASIATFASMLLSPVGGFLAVLVVGLGSFIHTAAAKAPESGVPRGARGLIPLIALLAAFITIRWVEREFLVEPFKTPSESMMPTLFIGDQFVIYKLKPKLKRGDVVVFRPPMHRDVHFVQRIVAMAGDSVEIRSGLLRINGKAQTQAQLDGCGAEIKKVSTRATGFCEVARETSVDGKKYEVMWTMGASRPEDFPATATDCLQGTHFFEGRCEVEAGYVFVLGDTRDDSYDSRSWGGLPVDSIDGRAVGVFFSFDGWKPRVSRMGIEL